MCIAIIETGLSHTVGGASSGSQLKLIVRLVREGLLLTAFKKGGMPPPLLLSFRQKKGREPLAPGPGGPRNIKSCLCPPDHALPMVFVHIKNLRPWRLLPVVNFTPVGGG